MIAVMQRLHDLFVLRQGAGSLPSVLLYCCALFLPFEGVGEHCWQYRDVIGLRIRCSAFICLLVFP
jgi:hypothetical protein